MSEEEILLDHYTKWTICATVFCLVFVGLFLAFLILYMERTHTSSIHTPTLTASQIHPMKQGKGKILVVYSYHEAESTRAENLQYFVDHGMMLNTTLIDYIFVVSSDVCSVVIPHDNNVRVIKRENQGWDFGNWSAGIQQVKDEDSLKNYNCFAFLNDSIRGPFIQKFPEAIYSSNWLSIFTKKLNDQVLIVGPTINCQYFPHVQSYLFVLNEKGFEIAMSQGIFDRVTEKNTPDLIQKREIGLSKTILELGYNIDCVLDAYQGYDWKTVRHCNQNMEGQDLNPTESPFEGKRTLLTGRNRNYLTATDTIFAKCKVGHHQFEPIMELCDQ